MAVHRRRRVLVEHDRAGDHHHDDTTAGSGDQAATRPAGAPPGGAWPAGIVPSTTTRPRRRSTSTSTTPSMPRCPAAVGQPAAELLQRHPVHAPVPRSSPSPPSGRPGRRVRHRAPASRRRRARDGPATPPGAAAGSPPRLGGSCGRFDHPGGQLGDRLGDQLRAAVAAHDQQRQQRRRHHQTCLALAGDRPAGPTPAAPRRSAIQPAHTGSPAHRTIHVGTAPAPAATGRQRVVRHPVDRPAQLTNDVHDRRS